MNILLLKIGTHLFNLKTLDLKFKKMKIGTFVCREALLERGFTFYCYFEHYMVYKKDTTYVFIDYVTQKIATILTPPK